MTRLSRRRMICLLPPPLPPQSVSSTSDTREDGESETTYGGGGGDKSYDGEEAWSSINHLIREIHTSLISAITVYKTHRNRS